MPCTDHLSTQNLKTNQPVIRYLKFVFALVLPSANSECIVYVTLRHYMHI